MLKKRRVAFSKSLAKTLVELLRNSALVGDSELLKHFFQKGLDFHLKDIRLLDSPREKADYDRE